MKSDEDLIVLMADDDQDDCALAKDALEESGSKGVLVCVEDGFELFDFLRGSGRYKRENHSLPALILLDLNMPGKDGRQVLTEMKAFPEFQNIPIVVLTTSREKKDKDYSLRMGAKSFITKPITFSDWVRVMKSFSDKWLEDKQT